VPSAPGPRPEPHRPANGWRRRRRTAARACGARGVRVDTDAAFEPALRTALAASGPTVIQLALDRRWVSVDDNPGTQPPA